MSLPTDSGAQQRRMRQTTTYGNPGRERSPKFFKWATRFLSIANKILRVLVYTSTIVICALIVYTGLGVHHVDLYVSDGGDFSCKLNSNKGTSHEQ